MPSKASISLTKWPLPRPPTAGLQDICPIVSLLVVKRQTDTFFLAAAQAASEPACPPPTTITSKYDFIFLCKNF